jgi:hypothetical protein
MPICVWRRAFEADHPYRLSLHVHRAIMPVYHSFSDVSYQGSLMLWVVCFRKLHWQNLMMRVAHQTFCDQTSTLEICILFGRRSSKLSASCARKFSVSWVRLSWLIPEINTQFSHVFTSWTSSHYISARWLAPVWTRDLITVRFLNSCNCSLSAMVCWPVMGLSITHMPCNAVPNIWLHLRNI